MTASSLKKGMDMGRRVAARALRCIIAVAVASVGLSACAQHDSPAAPLPAATAAPSVASSPPAVAAQVGPAGNACELLGDAQVRRVFPEAASGKRRTDGLQYGLDRCAWKTPSGQVGIELSKVEAGAFENELRGELTGFVDPRIEGAAGQIRLQPVAGIGDHAFAVLEKADAKRGILADIALLAVQRGHRMAVLMASGSSPDTSLSKLDQLEELARAMAQRL